MTTSLSNFMSKIKVEDSIFFDGRSREIAEEVCKRHTLQSVLESLSDLKSKEKDKPVSLTQAENIQYLNKVVYQLKRGGLEQWLASLYFWAEMSLGPAHSGRFLLLLLYLRNKETQQTLWGIVDWLCNARLSCIPSYYMKAVSKGQNTAGLVTISVTYA